jgi:arylsulfatase A-like enzyme
MNSQPNILFVFSDQHRWCDLGCYGNSEVLSPNIDALAERGITINQCLSNSPLCVPARGSLLTAQYPLKHKAAANDLPVDSSCESVATILRKAGYHTGYMGKWHLAGVPREKHIPAEDRLGFEEWRVCNCSHNYLDTYYDDEMNRRHEIEGYDAEAYTEMAVDFIERNREAPWGLWLSWGPPHDPYHAVPEKYKALYDGKELTLRENVSDLINQESGRGKFWTKEDARHNLMGYYAHISALDEQIGRLVEVLDRTGQFENTIVVYTSDHGDQLGSQGYANKQLPFEESVRVPLIASGPGIPVNCQSEAMIGLVDIAPSLLGLVGLDMGETDGRKLPSVFTDAEDKGLEDCYLFDLVNCHQSFWRGTDAWRAVRSHNYTYACKENGEPWLLYDNQRDSLQQNNLVGDPFYANIQKELHERIIFLTNKHDGLEGWETILKKSNLIEAWNESQRYFGEPELSVPND